VQDWKAADLFGEANAHKWQTQLNDHDIAELDAALDRWQATGKRIEQVWLELATAGARLHMHAPGTSLHAPLGHRWQLQFFHHPHSKPAIQIESPADFPLPCLGPKLLAIQEEIIHGKGLALIK
jgi:hypothetical protein